MAVPPLVKRDLPGLVDAECAKTSDATRRYNCIAHAAGESSRWWWHTGRPLAYWPRGVPEEGTLAAYEAAFATRGYRVCASGSLESGVEKIAIFVDASQAPTHAARQLPDGIWTSKFGSLEDMSHVLKQAEGTLYGTIARFMSRPRKP